MQTDKKICFFYVRNVSTFDFITCDPLLSRNHLIIFAFVKLLGEYTQLFLYLETCTLNEVKKNHSIHS